MLLIDCPHCGPRDETEFSYGGEAHVAYPADPHALSDAEWARFLFYRANPQGLAVPGHDPRWTAWLDGGGKVPPPSPGVGSG